MITYAVDISPEFAIGTLTTHACDAGFTLVGDAMRTCEDDDQADVVGVWSGSPPTCERMAVECYKSLLSVLKNCLFDLLQM